MSEVKQLKGATGFRHTATTVKTRARDNSNTYSELDLETLIHFRREKKKIARSLEIVIRFIKMREHIMAWYSVWVSIC